METVGGPEIRSETEGYTGNRPILQETKTIDTVAEGQYLSSLYERAPGVLLRGGSRVRPLKNRYNSLLRPQQPRLYVCVT